MRILRVSDESSKCCGRRYLNSQICVILGAIQLLVCMWGLAQHIHSYNEHGKLLKCDFQNGSLPLVAADAVIFDLGLFHSIWGIRSCVAEYIDGGLGRLCWCVSHIISLLFSLPFAFCSRPKPRYLWPLLLQQSAYGICLLMLTLAALPPMMMSIAGPGSAPVAAICAFLTGTGLNFLLLYIYWHWYWHVESDWNSVVRVPLGAVVRNANNRSRRDLPKRPKRLLPPTPREDTVDSVDPLTLIPPLSLQSLDVTRLDRVEEEEEEEQESPIYGTPPPPIVATRILPDDEEDRRPSRRLPPTPPFVMSTRIETPTGQPRFYLPE